VEVRQVPEPLLEVEAVADEQLVRHGETDVAHGQVVDETPVRAVEQRHDRERSRRTKGEGAAQVPQREAGVDDVLDDEDVAARELDVEVLQEANPCVAAEVAIAAVARELDEVEVVEDGQRPGEIGDEDEARLQRADEEGLRVRVVARDLRA
jgi:hypothetical protein